MRLTRKELIFMVGLTNFDTCLRMLWVHILMSASACAYMCLLVLLFISPLLLLACLCVLWLYIIVLVVLSSVRPFVWYSGCMSVCMYVHMYLCRDEHTSVCTVDIENWIDLTDTLSGLSLHWTLISFGCFYFVSRFKGRHCRYVHLFMQKLCLRSQKKYTYICQR